MRRYLALIPILAFLCCSLAARADDGAISQQIRAHLEQIHDANAPARSPAPQLRDLSLAEAVNQFYELRNFAPAWTKPAHVEALLLELGTLREDGLDPEDYHLAELRQKHALLQAGAADVIAQAEFDLLASTAYLRSLAHLFRGKVKPVTLDAQWNFALHDMATEAALTLVNNAVVSGDIAGVYAQARPQHRLYQNARKALAALRDIEKRGGWPALTIATTLKPGMQDPQVAVLRQRLAIAGYLPAPASGPAATIGSADNNGSAVYDNNNYDEELANTVRLFQRENYLDTDGAIGPATRTALNVSVADRIDQVRVNLERGRWLLHDIADSTVVVDIAGYKVYFLKHGKPIWQANVQVGKPYRSTPTFKSNITYVTFNPTWTVPPTIYKKDILPKIRRDAGYLAKNNMRVLTPGGKEINASSVNWNSPGNILLRADAGPDNPLGQVVIRFPNPYAVYLHDTSHKEFFDKSQRALSSGCIRVERPLELVELLLNDTEKWNRAAIDSKIAEGKTRNFDLATPVPLLLAYWTVDVLDIQRIAFKPDIYKRDPPLLRALNQRL
ncbi:MAG: L,D-transpeptidase family protein [Spongiibacteraceae bacterium]